MFPAARPPSVLGALSRSLDLRLLARAAGRRLRRARRLEAFGGVDVGVARRAAARRVRVKSRAEGDRVGDDAVRTERRRVVAHLARAARRVDLRTTIAAARRGAANNAADQKEATGGREDERVILSQGRVGAWGRWRRVGTTNPRAARRPRAADPARPPPRATFVRSGTAARRPVRAPLPPPPPHTHTHTHTSATISRRCGAPLAMNVATNASSAFLSSA